MKVYILKTDKYGLEPTAYLNGQDAELARRDLKKLAAYRDVIITVIALEVKE